LTDYCLNGSTKRKPFYTLNIQEQSDMKTEFLSALVRKHNKDIQPMIWSAIGQMGKGKKKVKRGTKNKATRNKRGRTGHPAKIISFTKYESPSELSLLGGGDENIGREFAECNDLGPIRPKGF